MKVGTDGVLLGTWADLSSAKRILDVGSGCGVIALICAQRSSAAITGIELDEQAALQAGENVNDSPWKERVRIRNISFQNFAAETGDPFDVIVSNPPFFENAKKAAGESRNLARHADTLPFKDLISCCSKLLSDDGFFFCILPISEAESFPLRARTAGLYLTHKTVVLPREESSAKRVLLGFSKSEKKVKESMLAIFRKGSEFHTDEFKNLTKDFYLNF
jgi:tRNA1Val (adenine37-N6)-methyltransferase